MDEAPASRRTRRRGQELTAAIYAAALTEASESGIDAASFERIAGRAATGKTSLYRRWNTPEALLVDALSDPSHGYGAVPEIDTGNLRSDLYVLLRHFADTLDQPRGRVLQMVLTQRGRYPDLHDRLRATVLQPPLDAITVVLHRAAERGEVDRTRITPRTAGLAPSLVLLAYLSTGEISDGELTQLLDEVVLHALRTS